jgi:hypothetical protein
MKTFKSISALIIILAISSQIFYSCNKKEENLTSNKYLEEVIGNFRIIKNNDNIAYINYISKKTLENGLFISNDINIDDHGKISSKINSKIWLVHFDSKNNIKIDYIVNPIYNCNCPDDKNNPLNYCEDFVDSENRLRCRGVNCCEGYITYDSKKETVKKK